MHKRYIVRLTPDERAALQTFVRKGTPQAYRLRHAHVLLQADADGPAWPDTRIATAVAVHPTTIAGIRQRFVAGGVERALARKPQATPSRARRLDGRGEARLITLACSTPPAGRARWTLQLLADQLVALEMVDTIAPETVRQTLKKTA